MRRWGLSDFGEVLAEPGVGGAGGEEEDEVVFLVKLF